MVRAHPEIALALEGAERAIIEDLETRLGAEITISRDKAGAQTGFSSPIFFIREARVVGLIPRSSAAPPGP